LVPWGPSYHERAVLSTVYGTVLRGCPSMTVRGRSTKSFLPAYALSFIGVVPSQSTNHPGVRATTSEDHGETKGKGCWDAPGAVGRSWSQAGPRRGVGAPRHHDVAGTAAASPARDGRDGKMLKARIGSGLQPDARAGLTGQMQNRVRRFWVLLKALDGLRRGAHDDLHAASLGLGQDLIHDR
jgi:hypothetical protein